MYLQEEERNNAIALLFNEKCSCVVRREDTIRIFRRRGVRDLLQLLHEEPSFTAGAFIADKVVGKGAAALMVLCRFQEVFADVISTPARRLLEEAKIHVRCSVEVPNIIDRTGTGICPVERLCSDCKTAEECLPRIEKFVADMTHAHKGA
ncbi:MAG: DUF1893 domain-containing protein [Alistipes sp.]|nr:DUF1893 domain-containing protein [Alistipes sp.]